MPKALLVDDDEGFLLGLGEAVKREGFEVRTAGSVQAARQALREYDPDALLIDLQLPDGSGLELLQAPEGKLPPTDQMSTSVPDMGTAEPAPEGSGPAGPKGPTMRMGNDGKLPATNNMSGQLPSR